MDAIAAYGMVTSLSPPTAPVMAPASPVAVAGSEWPGGPLRDLVAHDKWTSSAIGAVLIIGFALYANALLDAS